MQSCVERDRTPDELFIDFAFVISKDVVRHGGEPALPRGFADGGARMATKKVSLVNPQNTLRIELSCA